MPTSVPSHDRNVLLGVVALQLGFITRDALVAGMQAWVLEKRRPFAEVLVERGDLDPADRAMLDTVVDRHVSKHRGSAARSLASLGESSLVRRALATLGDEDVTASLANLSPGSADAPTTEPHLADERVSIPPFGATTSAGTRFTVLRKHAKGGLGQVYVARDEEIGREVALKEIQEQNADHPGYRSRFELEAQINGNLEHPGIVPVYGRGAHEDGRPYYVMRFIKGDRLADGIARYHREAGSLPSVERSLRLRELLRRFVDVCEAIAYAHSRGVLHRDLKPSNIMLGPYGETLIIDWGLAKATGHRDIHAEDASGERPLIPLPGGGVEPTVAGTRMGSPKYMSPEQAEGRLKDIGPATDVYGLGATLYHLLTNSPPIEPGTDAEVHERVCRGEIRPFRAAGARVPKPLQAICLQAMKLRPEDRYPGATELAADIERWLADEPVSCDPEPFLVRSGRWVRRHKTPVAVGAVLLVAVVAGLAVDDIRVNREKARVEAARKDADENFGMARSAVIQFLTQVAEDVLPAIPQSETMRRDAIRASLDMNERFLRRDPENPSVIGDALRVYRESVTVALLMNDLDLAKDVLDRALALGRRNVEAKRGDSSRAILYAYVLVDAGNVATDRGELDRAGSLYTQAMDTARPWIGRPDLLPGPGPRFPLALAIQGLARIRFIQGRDADAIAEATKAGELLRALANSSGGDLQPHLMFVRNLVLLGEALDRAKQPAEARRRFEHAVALCAKLFKEGPAIPTIPGLSSFAAMEPSFRSSRARAQLALAARGPAADEAIRDLESLCRDHPQTMAFQSDLADGLLARGRAKRDAGDSAGAVGDARRAVATAERLARAFPKDRRFRGDYGHALGELGRALLASGDREAARAALRSAVREQVAAYGDEPPIASRRETLRDDRALLETLKGD